MADTQAPAVIEEERAGGAPRGARRRVWLSASAITVAALAVGGAIAFGDGMPSSEARRTRDTRAAVVRVVVAERASLPLRLQLRGELVAEVAELAAQSTGYLVDLTVGLGDSVEKGQVLARVEANQAEREIAQARALSLAAEANRTRARAELQAAERERERADRALAQGLVSEQEAAARRAQVDVARADLAASEAQVAETRARIALSHERLRDTKLTAPFDGAVAARFVDAGTMVRDGTMILRLVKRGPLTVRFRIPERDLGRVAPGAGFEITTQATGSTRHHGEVARIAAEVTRIDRSVAVEGVIDEEHEALRPGMYAVVELRLGTLDDAVVVPSVALVDRVAPRSTDDPSGDVMQTGVFVARDGHAHFMPVTVTTIAGDRAAVAPLEAGAQVVVVGQGVLQHGAALRVLESGEEP